MPTPSWVNLKNILCMAIPHNQSSGKATSMIAFSSGQVLRTASTPSSIFSTTVTPTSSSLLRNHNTVDFLDTTVFLANHQLRTDLFYKPTDSHNYLLYSSAHPNKCKDSIPYSQYLRIRRICSTISDYDRHMKMMTLHFLDRGYRIDLL